MKSKMSNSGSILFFLMICVEVQFLTYAGEGEPVPIQPEPVLPVPAEPVPPEPEPVEPVRKYPWKVEENEFKVEKLVVAYAEKIIKSPATLQRLFSKRMSDDPPTAIDDPPTIPIDDPPTATDNRLLVDFYEITEEDKLLMCNAIIRLNYFGLEFVPVINDDYNMDIDQQTVSFRRLNVAEIKPKTNTLSMFACPKLRYIDLETGESVDLMLRYFISGAHFRNSFLLYIQEALDTHIYPHKYASEVTLVKFDELRAHYKLTEQDDESNTEKMTVHPELSTAEERLDEFLKSRKSQEPEFPDATLIYKKFQDLFKNMGVCGMPRAHLVALCRYIAHNMEKEIDHRGYDEFRCRKREVHVFSKPAKPEDPKVIVPRGVLHMVKCPAVVTEVYADTNKFAIETMFVATNKRARSVMVLERSNLRGKNVMPDVNISGLKLPMLKKERNRIREFLKPEYTVRKPRYSNITTSLIKLSGLNISVRGPPTITFNRNIVEDQTTLFLRIKEIKTPYDRFEASYTSSNINMWPAKDIEFLCHLLLQDKTYNLDFEPDETAEENLEDRSQIQVQFVMRDAELLDEKITSIKARRCPNGFQSPSTPSTHFIVGTIRKDAIIVHVKYDDKDYIFPEAYIENISRAEIQAVTSNKKLFPIPK